ncbi:D-amino acid dehydrogenase small subunit [plant metagenome]|uniref:D-amino acid dehydrogenase small subunit n=1 Tax=plant metagenome TaxID=1297885 RepID=A0A484SKP9_9ZZZZ
MKIAVLGSGILGTSSAWWLRQAGHDVVVLDRAAGPAQETSLANGGQISVSYAEPWANPQAPLKLLRWMLRDDAPLLFRPQADWRQWQWGLAFLRECLPSRLAPNIRALVSMAEYSRGILRQMRTALDIDYDQLSRGILNIYRDPAQFEASQRAAGMMREFGVDRRAISADEAVRIEPALAAYRHRLVGADYTPEDESGDVHRFTVALAERAADAGVEFLFSTQATRLHTEGGRVSGVELIGADGRYGLLKADAYVAAAGSFTPALVRPLGVSCPVYPAKGYSATFPVLDPDAAPSVSLTDSGNKVVISRLGDRLRMAGTAEFAGYSRALNPARCQMLAQLAGELFPGALDIGRAAYWSGLRPATPSNVPLIGRTRVPNLYLNTGHGTLGWTMGVGSGKALADIVDGRRPEPEFPFIGL